MSGTSRKIAIIDPIGGQAGMDNYDKGLATGMTQNGLEVYLYSNFKLDFLNVVSKPYFFEEKDGGIFRYFNFFHGHIKAMLHCRFNGVRFVVNHFFAAHIKELVLYTIVKIFGGRPISIVHDISSLSTTAGVNWIQKYVFAVSEKLVVHNEFSRKRLAEIVGVESAAKIAVIKHGGFMEFQFEEDSRLIDLDRSKINILFFGQIKRVKGLDILLEAMASTPKEIHLVVAGRPWKDDFDFYQKIIEKHNLSLRCTLLLRFITDGEREYLMRQCHAVVLPYRKIYQSGVLLLAMSKGIPAIVSDLEPNKEIIEHGETGYIFKSESAKDLARVITKVGMNESVLSLVKKNAMDLIEREYSWRQIGEDYKALVEAGFN